MTRARHLAICALERALSPQALSIDDVETWAQPVLSLASIAPGALRTIRNINEPPPPPPLALMAPFASLSRNNNNTHTRTNLTRLTTITTKLVVCNENSTRVGRLRPSMRCCCGYPPSSEHKIELSTRARSRKVAARPEAPRRK